MQLRKLSNLQSLVVASFTPGIFGIPDKAVFTDEGLIHLKALTALRSLAIVGKFTDRGLSNIKEIDGLQRLNILFDKESVVTQASLTHLGGLNGLRSLFDLPYPQEVDH